MLTLLLSWLFCLASPDAHAASAYTSADSLTVRGICWDVVTGIDMPSRITAVVNGKRRPLGQSDAAGKFAIQIPDSTQALTFEVNGYPTTTMPISRSGSIDSNARFVVGLPLIRPDSQHTVRAFTPPVPPRSARSNRKQQAVYFQVQNARTFRRIPVTICFRYTASGRTQCVAIDSAKTPSFALLNRNEPIQFEVRAEGYQPYTSELAAEQAETSLHQIKLMMLNNALVAAYDVPTGLKLSGHGFQNIRTRHSSFGGEGMVPRPSEYLEWTIFKPGETYRFMATAQDGQVVADATFRMATGWTFAQFHLNRPQPTRLASRDSLRPAYFDSAVLYFDQSTYDLRPEARGKLDSISWQMLKIRQMGAHVTGYTDNVGQRALNLTLSEYRSRVVTNYLRQKGVGSERVSTAWRGPDAPAAPNDSEVNKARNRRVVVRLFNR